MNIIIGIFGAFVIMTIIVFLWEVIKNFFMDLYISKQTIRDVKENIIDCLDEADGLGYEIMFRTPKCVAYKDCNLHIAKTEDGKEVIMIDLILKQEIMIGL